MLSYGDKGDKLEKKIDETKNQGHKERVNKGILEELFSYFYIFPSSRSNATYRGSTLIEGFFLIR